MKCSGLITYHNESSISCSNYVMPIIINEHCTYWSILCLFFLISWFFLLECWTFLKLEEEEEFATRWELKLPPLIHQMLHIIAASRMLPSISSSIVIRKHIIKDHISIRNHIEEHMSTQNMMGELKYTTPYQEIGYKNTKGSTSRPWDLIRELNLNLESERVISTHPITYWSSHQLS